MFKKPFPSPASSLVRASECKKLKHTLVSQFPALGEGDPRIIDVLLPSKNTQRHKVKLTKEDRIVYVYAVDSVPAFVDLEGGRGDLFPTVYSLWRFPDIMPTLYINSYTSTFILGGADPMLPGVLQPPGGLGNFERGQKRSITVVGNPVPFGVGRMILSGRDARKQKMKGKAMEMVHLFHDHLWQLCGTHGHPQHGIPDGFTATQIHTVVVKSNHEQNHNESSSSQHEEKESEQQEQQQDPIQDKESETEHHNSSDMPSSSSSSQTQQIKDEKGESTDTNDQVEEITAEEMDQYLRESFLDSLVNRIPESALPINISNIYSDYMQTWEGGPRVDVKQSSYKKISKFLKEMTKDKLVSVKGNLLTRINREHPKYCEFKELYGNTHDQKATEYPSKRSSSRDRSQNGGSNSRISVSVLYGSMPRPLGPIAGLQTTKDVLFEPKEVAPMLRNYIEHHKLVRKGGRNVELDNVLRHLFKNSKAGEQRTQMEVSKAFKESFTQLNLVRDTVTGESQVHKKQLKKVEVIVERRMGNKKVTRILNLSTYPGMDVNGIAQTLQRHLATSTSVSEMPGKGQGKEILCQGHLMKKLCDFLVKECGLPQKCIVTTDKTAKNRKKK